MVPSWGGKKIGEMRAGDDVIIEYFIGMQKEDYLDQHSVSNIITKKEEKNNIRKSIQSDTVVTLLSYESISSHFVIIRRNENH